MNVRCAQVVSCFWGTLLLFFHPAGRAAVPGDSLQLFGNWLANTETDFQRLHLQHSYALVGTKNRLVAVDSFLRTPRACDPEIGYAWLLEKIQLEDSIRLLEADAALKQLRLRYRKGIEMLKMLYEKILSLDHHFTSLRTSQQIARISNPHEYPDFKALNGILEERMKKKFGFSLPALLESNPYLSATFSIVGMALGAGDSRQNQSNLEKISCILDFTVRMDQQLSIIQYETEFLRDANLSLKRECELLFSDCARQIGYTTTLPQCRDQDDWEQLNNHLEQYINTAEQAIETNPALPRKAHTNLQFSIDRIVHFLDQYCAFIAQGNVYYQKFARIVGSYQHEAHCAAILPDTFSSLKSDIEITLEKFNNAYYLPEMQGSRLKDLLYGIED